MLSTQVAAVEHVAFAINSSGFVMPLWEQVLYNIEAQLRADGFSAAEVAEAVKFETLAIEVMRTGHNWDDYQVEQAAVLQKKWWSAYFWIVERLLLARGYYAGNGNTSIDSIRDRPFRL